MAFHFFEIKEQLFIVSQNAYIHVLAWLIVLDIASGLIKSFKKNTSNSTTALFGIVKHVLVLFLVILESVYLPLMGFDTISLWIVFYLIVSYLISFAENWVQIGLPAPDFLIEMLEKVKHQMDIGESIKITTPEQTKIEIKKGDNE